MKKFDKNKRTQVESGRTWFQKWSVGYNALGYEQKELNRRQINGSAFLQKTVTIGSTSLCVIMAGPDLNLITCYVVKIVHQVPSSYFCTRLVPI